MKNITVLQLAEKIMHAHNETCSEIFMDIELNIKEELIQFDIITSAIGEAIKICELLNLTFRVDANTDPKSDKTLNFYIN